MRKPTVLLSSKLSKPRPRSARPLPLSARCRSRPRQRTVGRVVSWRALLWDNPKRVAEIREFFTQGSPRVPTPGAAVRQRNQGQTPIGENPGQGARTHSDRHDAGDITPCPCRRSSRGAAGRCPQLRAARIELTFEQCRMPNPATTLIILYCGATKPLRIANRTNSAVRWIFIFSIKLAL